MLNDRTKNDVDVKTDEAVLLSGTNVNEHSGIVCPEPISVVHTSSVSSKIISIDEVGRIRSNDRIILCNRVSTRSQSHRPYAAVLRVVYQQLGCKQPFERLLYKIKGNGGIGTASGKRYFIWLEQVLRAGLAMLGANGTLYALFVTRGRIFRPPGYEGGITATWNPTQADYDALDEWLVRHFLQDADRIVFVIVFDHPDGASDRRIETDIGANYKAQQITAKWNNQDREQLRREAERLSAAGWNGCEIHRHFERMLKPWIPHETTIQDWAHKAGTGQECGKRKLTKCQNDIRYMQDSLLPQCNLIPLLLGDESNVESSQGYIHVSTSISPNPSTHTIPNIKRNMEVVIQEES
jgi:hypothetical protein